LKGAIVQEEKQNYGAQGIGGAGQVAGGPASPTAGRAGVSATEERTWSVLAHLSIFANIFTGFLGPVVALIIWLVYRDRSEKVAFHALQSLWYQIAWLVVLGIGWVTAGVLTVVLIGLLLMPVMLILTGVPFVHAAYAAYRVSQGDEYRYALVADMMQGR
jgi:uncharacterized Tic20 family protein